jgi:hypothetical protein
MEGTSGAAERVILRGNTREAILGGARRVSGGRRAGSEITGASDMTARRRRYSNLCRHEFATRGVRVDRVGAKLLSRAIAIGGAEALRGESTRAAVPDP